MATVKSYQVTDKDASPKVMLKPNEGYARARALWFSFDTGAAGPAVGDVIQLVTVPAKARVLGIYANWEAMSSGAGVAGGDFGDGGDPDRFITALSMDAAGSGFQALRLDGTNGLREPALGVGYEYTIEDTVDITVTGEAWAANAMLRGFVLIARD